MSTAARAHAPMDEYQQRERGLGKRRARGRFTVRFKKLLDVPPSPRRWGALIRRKENPNPHFLLRGS